jgi:hypothetical protein
VRCKLARARRRQKAVPRAVIVPCSALVLITANNTSLRADMLRRTLPVRIVAETDQPELRRFSFEPYQEALRLRGEIVAAGLTIARAWWLARDTDDGRLIRQTTLGSFEQWADLVAGAVEWLTGMNPVKLIEDRKAEDPGRGAEWAVINALRELFGNSEWTAKDAVGQAGDISRKATGIDRKSGRLSSSSKATAPPPNRSGTG